MSTQISYKIKLNKKEILVQVKGHFDQQVGVLNQNH